MSIKKKYIGLLWAVPLVIAIVWGIRFYQVYRLPNVQKEGKLYIPTGADFAQVMDSLQPFLKKRESFVKAAAKENYPSQIKAGRYTMIPGENNRGLINRLRLGLQDEIAIRIGNYSSIYQMAGRVSPFLEADSAEMVEAILNAPFSKGYDPDVLTFYFLPDTYHFHWNTSGRQFADKMKKEFDRFWNAERRDKAEKMNKTLLEVVTLASIVQLESSKTDEQPLVARLYLNRLEIGMKLDADPTVIFAMMRQNNGQRVQRVYYKNLRIRSPYNTYLYKGIPPGPICMPNPSAIDAVLEPAAHDYLYFVADPARPGYHIFAKTLKEHEKNAKIYRSWLDENAIR